MSPLYGRLLNVLPFSAARNIPVTPRRRRRGKCGVVSTVHRSFSSPIWANWTTAEVIFTARKSVFTGDRRCATYRPRASRGTPLFIPTDDCFFWFCDGVSKMHTKTPRWMVGDNVVSSSARTRPAAVCAACTDSVPGIVVESASLPAFYWHFSVVVVVVVVEQCCCSDDDVMHFLKSQASNVFTLFWRQI